MGDSCRVDGVQMSLASWYDDQAMVCTAANPDEFLPVAPKEAAIWQERHPLQEKCIEFCSEKRRYVVNFVGNASGAVTSVGVFIGCLFEAPICAGAIVVKVGHHVVHAGTHQNEAAPLLSASSASRTVSNHFWEATRIATGFGWDSNFYRYSKEHL